MNWHLAWLFLLVPAVIGFMFWLKHQDTVYAVPYGVYATLQKMLTMHSRIAKLKHILFYTALVFIIIALLRPQWGMRTETVESRGLDIVFALDISKSMYAEDVQPDRLTRARMTILDLLQRLNGNRAGLVVFAGSASAVCPLTTDYGALEVFLQSIASFSEAVPGTNFENAFRTGSKLFEEKAPQDKVFMLFTDGENHEGSLDAIRAMAAQQHIIIVPVAVGTPGGQPVPDYDEQDNRLGYKKDKQGNIVISHLDMTSLAKIASIGPYTLDQAALSIPADLQRFKHAKLRDQRVALYAERYQGFLLVGLLLLLLSYCISEYKDPLKK
jgi:Ca-activated chloride channel family protein